MRLAIVLIALAACDDVQTTPEPQGSSEEPDAGVDADGEVPLPGTVADAAVDATLTACEEAVYHSDLTWIQQKIFSASCTSSHCHGGTEPKADLHLLPGHSHHALVYARSTINTSWMRVMPGNPANSILMVRIGGEPGPSGNIMPLNQAPLCPEKIDAIRRWIASGAPNN